MAANNLSTFLKNLFGSFYIKRELDPEEFSNAIKKDIDYKGYNAWILGASILIASIGLNINSTAIVIGAMLISPLMGPLLGIGYAVATNDWTTLTRALRNLGLAVGISIIVSFLYFRITPFVEAESELLSRTSPTFLDVIIGFVGGMAGVLAVSRKEKSNVIPGVAIAAALMPPLCTAGFGLAIGNFSYFLGAFYLFMINVVFISTATFIFIKYLKLPRASFDPVKEKRARRYVLIFTIVTVIPSAYMLYRIVKKSDFQSRAELYIEEVITYDNCSIISKKVNYSKEGSGINLVMVGKHVPDSIQNKWKDMLKPYGLEGVSLNIIQPEFEKGDLTTEQIIAELKESGFVDERSKEDRQAMLLAKEEELAQLKAELGKYKTLYDKPVQKISEELKAIYPGIDKLAYSTLIQEKDSLELDTISYFIITTKSSKYQKQYQKDQAKMEHFLKLRLSLDTLIINYQ